MWWATAATLAQSSGSSVHLRGRASCGLIILRWQMLGWCEDSEQVWLHSLSPEAPPACALQHRAAQEMDPCQECSRPPSKQALTDEFISQVKHSLLSAMSGKEVLLRSCNQSCLEDPEHSSCSCRGHTRRWGSCLAMNLVYKCTKLCRRYLHLLFSTVC